MVQQPFILIFTRSCDLVVGVSYFVTPVFVLAFLLQGQVKVSFAEATPVVALCKHTAYCVAAFVLTCGITHLFRFTLIFADLPEVTAAFLLLCALVSVYTCCIASLCLLQLRRVVGKIEITAKGRTVDLSRAFDITASWLPDMLSVHNAHDYTYLHSNDVCSAYGYNPAMLFTVPLQDLVHPEDHPVVEHMMRSAQTQGTAQPCMYRFLCADRVYIHVESITKSGRWEGEDVLFMLTRNVQERVDRLDRAAHAKGELVRVEATRMHAMALAHDLRTHLSVFELAVKELRLQHYHLQAHPRQYSQAQAGQALTSAENAVSFMQYIVNRTIESCRVLQGDKPRPFLERISVPHETLQVVRMLDSYPKSVQIQCNFTELAAQHLICDREWLASILTSMLCNACDNTMYGEVAVRVSSSDAAQWVHFEVADTGVGVSQHDVPRLFCPFSTLENKLTPEHGIGIGLYNCAWRVRHLGGTYGMRSNEEAGRGSVFYFDLPLRAPPPGGPPPGPPLLGPPLGPPSGGQPLLPLTESPARSNSGRGSYTSSHASSRNNSGASGSFSAAAAAASASLRRPSCAVAPSDAYASLQVLIVDDAPIYRMLLARQLDNRGVVHMDQANDGEQGLQMLKEKHYDIAIFDVMMPIMNGSEAVRQYKQWEAATDRQPPTCAVLMSADSFKDDSDVLSAGYVHCFLPKPVNMARLMSVFQERVSA